jgi:hypothetical protein
MVLGICEIVGHVGTFHHYLCHEFLVFLFKPAQSVMEDYIAHLEYNPKDYCGTNKYETYD